MAKTNSGNVLSTDPPPGLKGKDARKAYSALAEILRDAGLATDIDTEAVSMAASSIVRVKRLRDEAEKVTDLIVMSAKGTIMVHPIFAEVRREETRLQSILDRLYLTPKSRQAKTTKEESARNLQASKAVKDKADAVILNMLGG